MIRTGDGEPLVLLHGITGSETMWRHVVPLLSVHHDVIALTLLGHRWGNRAEPGTTVADLIDDVEAQLDGLGLEQAHLAGNSLGGWVALELARRGRAASVCALSPAGCWVSGTREQSHATSRLRSLAVVARLTRPALGPAAHIPLVRKVALRENAVHGNRVSAAELVTLVDDLLACTVLADLLGSDEHLDAMDPLPCRVLLAWSEHDRILPEAVNGARARTLLPGAEYRVLAGVGHVPMFDDAQLTADVILEAAAS